MLDFILRVVCVGQVAFFVLFWLAVLFWRAAGWPGFSEPPKGCSVFIPFEWRVWRAWFIGDNK